jgi:hypothetical protein
VNHEGGMTRGCEERDLFLGVTRVGSCSSLSSAWAASQNSSSRPDGEPAICQSLRARAEISSCVSGADEGVFMELRNQVIFLPMKIAATTNSTTSTRKIKKRTLAMAAEAPAMPVKPSAPAMRAMMAKIKAHLSIG